jgi:hypothetical protein
MATCSFCGKPSDPEDPDAQLPLTWVSSLENGKTRVYCETCSRDHLRSIEAKLDADFW